MTLTLRNVPEAIHQRLKQQAQRNRRSLNQEAVAVFETALVPEMQSREAEIARILREIDQDRSLMKNFASAQEIDEARVEGRK
jgi:antitoxin FitA